MSLSNTDIYSLDRRSWRYYSRCWKVYFCKFLVRSCFDPTAYAQVVFVSGLKTSDVVKAGIEHVTNLLWLCRELSVTPDDVTPAHVCMCVSQLQLPHDTSRLSLSQSGSMLPTPLSANAPLWQHTNTNLKDLKAGVLIRCLQIHIQHDTSPPRAALFAALQKSDREASQLALSVPLSSYRRAAGCVELKGSHWWAVHRGTKALLSKWRGMLPDGLSPSRPLPFPPCSL